MRFLQIIIKKTQIRQVYLIVNIVLSAKITKSMKISLDVLSLSPGLQWLDLCRPKKSLPGFWVMAYKRSMQIGLKAALQST